MSFDNNVERAANRVSDIVEAADAICSYIEGYSFASYSADRRTMSAVERELLIIAEAVTRLLQLDDSLLKRFPNIAWPQIRGLENRLRHEYNAVDEATIWEMVAVSDDLKNLKAALLEAYPC